jgi:hypothetical protein
MQEQQVFKQQLKPSQQQFAMLMETLQLVFLSHGQFQVQALQFFQQLLRHTQMALA